MHIRSGVRVILLLCVVLSYAQVNNDLSWQDVYLVNNTEYPLEVTAHITGISNINDVEHETHPIERTTWNVPKRSRGKGAVIKLDALNLLHNISIRAVTADESTVPAWAQKPSPVPIKERRDTDTLIIYVGHTGNGWLIGQRYVQAVKIEYDSPSGYSILIDQP